MLLNSSANSSNQILLTISPRCIASFALSGLNEQALAIYETIGATSADPPFAFIALNRCARNLRPGSRTTPGLLDWGKLVPKSRVRFSPSQRNGSQPNHENLPIFGEHRPCGMETDPSRAKQYSTRLVMRQLRLRLRPDAPEGM
jgi:hypothetical protein